MEGHLGLSGGSIRRLDPQMELPMSTVAKGDAFERKVLKVIQRELESGRLGLSPDSCKIFHKRFYYSKDRGSNIEFDIAIEVTLPGADRWSLLWVWECKAYRTAVPVDDVEEFWAKLQQIGGVNIKGGLAIAGALQAGAFEFARSKGITVARILEAEDIDYPLYHQDRPENPQDIEVRRKQTIEQALTGLAFRGEREEFFAMGGDAYFSSMGEILKQWLSDYLEQLPEEQRLPIKEALEVRLLGSSRFFEMVIEGAVEPGQFRKVLAEVDTFDGFALAMGALAQSEELIQRINRIRAIRVPRSDLDWARHLIGKPSFPRDPPRVRSPADRLRSLVAAELGLEEEVVVPSACFNKDLGADSFDLLRLVLAVEREFGVEISDQAAEEILTVSDALRYIAQRVDPDQTAK